MSKLTNDLLKHALPEKGRRLELRDDEEPGLIFRVTDLGVRSWSVRYRNSAGEQRRKSLGSFPDVPLAKARKEARKVKGLTAGGADVVAADRTSRAAEARKRLRTISGLAEAYFADAALGLHRPNAKAPKRAGTLTEERRIFDRLIEPEMGATPISDLSRGDVQTFVSKQSRKLVDKRHRKKAVPHEEPRPLQRAISNGRHCRTVLRQLLAYAVWKDLLDHNPAHDIAVALPTPRERTLSDEELKAVWAACGAPQSVAELSLSPEMGLALKFAAVTLQRGGEVVGARLSEMNLDAATWLIPAARMKGKRPHLVTLSDMAIGIVKQALALTGSTDFVFASPRKDENGEHRPLDRRSFSRAMARIVEKLKMPHATPQDLRRTGATTITSERIGISRFVVSQVLAHAGDTGGAAAVTGRHYDLNDYVTEKRRALDAWAALLDEITSGKTRPSNVTPIAVGK